MTCTRQVAAVQPVAANLNPPPDPAVHWDAAGRAVTPLPAVSVPTHARDRSRDAGLRAQMRELLASGQAGGPLFQAVWRGHEAIKNRHGGLPPV
jgi:hypothetical protein